MAAILIPANAANAGTHRKGGERMKTKTVYRLAVFIVSLAMAAVSLVGCTSTRQDAVTLYETDTLIDVSRCIQKAIRWKDSACDIGRGRFRNPGKRRFEYAVMHL